MVGETSSPVAELLALAQEFVEGFNSGNVDRKAREKQSPRDSDTWR